MTRMDSFIRPNSVILVVMALSLVMLMNPSMSQAQTTDITPSGLGTNVLDPVDGRTSIIGGTTAGSNLFHSFGNFSIGTGEMARFETNSGVANVTVSNILSRVTGGSPSDIFGTINSQTFFPNADLFLLNPAGFLFGPNATIDVGGSANFVAGDYLRMGETALFFANPALTSTLSVAAVTSFGFLAGNPVGTIRIEGGTVKNASALTLVGRDKVDGTTVTPGIEVTGTLSNIGGKVTLVSVGTPGNAGRGEVTVADQKPTGFDSLGTIALKSGSSIDTSTNSSVNNPMAAGAIVIRGDRLEMDGTSLRAISRGYNINPDVGALDPFVNVTAGDLDITVNTLNMHNSTIQTGSAPFLEDLLVGGIGTVGDITGSVVLSPGTIRLNVQDILAQDSFISTASSLNDGKGGFLSIKGIGGSTAEASSVNLVNTILSLNAGPPFGTSQPGGGGEILSKDVTLAGLSHESHTNEGVGGDFVIHGSNSITLENSEFNSTSFFGLGGRLLFEAGSKIDLVSTTLRSGADSGVSSGDISFTAPVINMTGGRISTDSAGLRAGNISFHVDTLTVQAFNNGTTVTPAVISSSHSETQFVDAPFRAGQITIEGLSGPGSSATSVSLDNSTISTTIASGTSSSIPATIEITAQTVNLTNGAQIKADTSGGATAGAVTLTATESIALTDGSSVSSSTSIGTGAAGQLVITAPSVTLEQSSSLQTATSGPGKAGNIEVNGTTVKIISGSVLNSSTSGEGDAGTIAIKANESVLVSGADNSAGFRSVSKVASISDFLGAAGSVTIEAPMITVSDEGVISTSTSFFGDRAGDVRLTGRDIFIQNGAQISSATQSLFGASGGTVTINGSDSVTIQGSGLSGTATRVATTTFFGGSGGAITVNAKQLTVDGAELQAITGGSGQAGNIVLSAQDAVISGGTQIDSSSLGTGKAGAINVTSSTSLTVSGQRPVGASSTRIASSGFVAGDAGTVTLSSPIMNLVDSAEVRTGGSGSADAGAISVNGRRVLITGGSFLDSSTLGSGIGGAVAVTATESVTIAGRDATGFLSGITTLANGAGDAGQISMTTPSLQLMDGANLSSNTAGAGKAGSIQLNVGQLSLVEGASVTSRARTLDGQPAVSGSGGSITVLGQSGIGTAANTVALDNARFVTSSEGSGDGGSIRLNSGSLNLTNGSLISATNEGTGDAGSVALKVGGLFSSRSSTVSSSAAQGAGGNVSITAGNMSLAGGTTVSAESAGSKDAGSIILTSATDLLMRNSKVTTFAAQASGGDIKLTAPNLVRLVDSTLTSSVQGQAGSDGGNINIDPQLVVIQNSRLLANANEGAGGNISIAATGAVLVDPNSRLSATAGPAGVSGSVNINAPIQVLSGALVPLNLVYSQAGLSGDRCAADPQGQFSSFVQTGRDGVPQVPGALSPSPLSFLDTLSSGSLGSPWPNVAAARFGLDSISFDDSTLFRFHSACRS